MKCLSIYRNKSGGGEKETEILNLNLNNQKHLLESVKMNEIRDAHRFFFFCAAKYISVVQGHCTLEIMTIKR